LMKQSRRSYRTSRQMENPRRQTDPVSGDCFFI
jgi:hypothetical protein